MAIKIYTRQFCPYCVRAKRLLDELGVQYQEIATDGKREVLEEMIEASGRHTVPQIWIGEQHIGGCNELMALHFSEELMPLIAKMTS